MRSEPPRSWAQYGRSRPHPTERSDLTMSITTMTRFHATTGQEETVLEPQPKDAGACCPPTDVNPSISCATREITDRSYSSKSGRPAKLMTQHSESSYLPAGVVSRSLYEAFLGRNRTAASMTGGRRPTCRTGRRADSLRRKTPVRRRVGGVRVWSRTGAPGFSPIGR